MAVEHQTVLSVYSHRKTLSASAVLLFILVLVYNRRGTYLIEYAKPQSRWFAVYGSSTPTKGSYRGLDYVFQLPLTALAWERIGFRSIVPIVGNRTEWITDRLLSFVLDRLEERKATTFFVDAPDHLQRLISQSVRMFAVNFEQFPAESDDYVITSDADLWPLRREHFSPREDKKLVLVHSQCCGFFQVNGTVYPMYAMCNIGATVATWRQIINEDRRFANDSASMIKYLEDIHGSRISDGAMAGNWYIDQETISLRIEQWIHRYSNESVHRVSDQGFDRIDRFRWRSDLNASLHNSTHFRRMFDAHLPSRSNWEDLEPLLQLMFDPTSSKIRWAEEYVNSFNQIVQESVI